MAYESEDDGESGDDTLVDAPAKRGYEHKPRQTKKKTKKEFSPVFVPEKAKKKS